MYMFILGCLCVILFIYLKKWFNKEIVISAKNWGETVPGPDLEDSELYDIYLAGPMRGRKDGNKQLFLDIGEKYENMGFSVWNPALQNDTDKTFTYCIRNDLIAIIEDCKSVLLLPEWRESLGTNIEVFTAYACGKPIRELVLDENNEIIGCGEIDSEFVLPFAPDHKEFRSPKEMTIPEKDVFNNRGDKNG